MSINDFKEKINPVLESSKNLQYRAGPFYTLILLVLVASIFFTLGRISALNDQKEPIKILNQAFSEGSLGQSGAVINSQISQKTDGASDKARLLSPGAEGNGGQVFGSKTGKKYYFPWCSTVKRIKPENLVTFESIEDARLKGYTPAGNCAGLR